MSIQKGRLTARSLVERIRHEVYTETIFRHDWELTHEDAEALLLHWLRIELRARGYRRQDLVAKT